MQWEAILVLIVSILTPIVTFMGFMYKEVQNWRAETRAETKKLEETAVENNKRFYEEAAIKDKRFYEEAAATESRFQEEIRIQREEMRIQAQRSDKLYEMFIALLNKQYPSKTNS